VAPPRRHTFANFNFPVLANKTLRNYENSNETPRIIALAQNKPATQSLRLRDPARLMCTEIIVIRAVKEITGHDMTTRQPQTHAMQTPLAAA
jgi:hypothetical protein